MSLNLDKYYKKSILSELCIKYNSRYGDSLMNKVVAIVLDNISEYCRWRAFLLSDLFPSPRLGLVP